MSNNAATGQNNSELSPPLQNFLKGMAIKMASEAASSSSGDTSSKDAFEKFHIFCEKFSIPKNERLPTTFAVLHSFILWAGAEPDALPHHFADDLGHHKPMSVPTLRAYVAAIDTWHLAHGWPSPLSGKGSIAQMDWSLRGIKNIQAQRQARLPRPPVTVDMLTRLRLSLDANVPFEACVWAVATCAYWGLMRVGEVTVPSKSAFDGSKHLKRSDLSFSEDFNGTPYAMLALPAAKTEKPGEIQRVNVYLAQQPIEYLCPVRALRNLLAKAPAAASDPLFSWIEENRTVQPMTRHGALGHISGVLKTGSTFGHSFRVGEAVRLLAKGTDSNIVRLAGRWDPSSFDKVLALHAGNQNMTSRTG